MPMPSHGLRPDRHRAASHHDPAGRRRNRSSSASAIGCSCRSRRSCSSWHGIRMMLAWRESGEHMFSFAKLLLVIAFGYAMIAYYELADPGHRRSRSRT